MLLTVPIMVAGADSALGQFTEETHTVVLNRDGARIVLRHPLAPEDRVRIINLDNFNEADFRVVGPVLIEGLKVPEWGVECLKEGSNIWGIEFPPPTSPEEWSANALLDCQGCKRRYFWPVTPTEVEVLDSSGAIQNFCDRCGKATYWVPAEVSHRLPEIPVPERPATKTSKRADKRAEKRIVMKLPILVRNQKGAEEITKTENISKGNLAVSLKLDLAIGDNATVICPYAPERKSAEKKAVVQRRTKSFFSLRSLYGLRLLV